MYNYIFRHLLFILNDPFRPQIIEINEEAILYVNNFVNNLLVNRNINIYCLFLECILYFIYHIIITTYFNIINNIETIYYIHAIPSHKQKCYVLLKAIFSIGIYVYIQQLFMW